MNYKTALYEALTILKNIHIDANMALKDDWDRSNDGFECQIKIIEGFCEKHDIDLDRIKE